MGRCRSRPRRRPYRLRHLLSPALAAACALLLGGGAAAGVQETEHRHGPPDAGVPLYEDLGSHHREIVVASPDAQAYFDQGLRLQYAFNHAEAIRSYEQALRHDPGCGMCWWGIALAYGPNINAPMDRDGARRAYAAIVQAKALAPGSPELEREMIAALAARYDADPEAARPPLDGAYAAAMEQLAAAHPDDADILALYGAALMNLSPWNYWSGSYDDRRPNADTPRMLEALRRAVEIAPANPGACHYYIHAVEAAYPERAVECADRLAALMPGAGHIVHMPGHIYLRVGRYADAVGANEHAVHADEAYIADRQPTGLYPSAYYPHNYHFMWFAASMAGMSAKALAAARTVAPKVPPEVARDVYWIQTVTVLPELAAITFGRWNEVLVAPPPPDEHLVGTAMHQYARGVAFAATGRFQDATGALAEIRRISEQLAAGASRGNSPAGVIVTIAIHMLSGEIDLRSAHAADAVDHFAAAAAIEDGMLYEEPPLWFFPVRHALGRALLEAGRPAEAEAAYRADLARFRDNGWSLLGLARALEAQGKHEEAAATWTRFRDAWKNADVEPTASHF